MHRHLARPRVCEAATPTARCSTPLTVIERASQNLPSSITRVLLEARVATATPRAPARPRLHARSWSPTMRISRAMGTRPASLAEARIARGPTPPLSREVGRNLSCKFARAVPPRNYRCARAYSRTSAARTSESRPEHHDARQASPAAARGRVTRPMMPGIDAVLLQHVDERACRPGRPGRASPRRGSRPRCICRCPGSSKSRLRPGAAAGRLRGPSRGCARADAPERRARAASAGCIRL